MAEEKKIQGKQEHGSIKSYTIGFVLSIILTFAAYVPTVLYQNSQHEIFSRQLLIPLLLIFAMMQFIVQLVFFLHLAKESKPRWNLVFFVSTFMLVLLVVVASIWIMDHLNYNMTPASMSNFILKDEGIRK